MNGFVSFVTAVCVAGVFIGILQLIAPDGAMEKSVKYILSLVFLVALISSAGFLARGVNFNIDFSMPETVSEEELRTESAKYAYETALKKAEINFREIIVCTDKSDDNSIVISKVIIYSDCEKEKILMALGITEKNTEVEIVNE